MREIYYIDQEACRQDNENGITDGLAFSPCQAKEGQGSHQGQSEVVRIIEYSQSADANFSVFIVPTGIVVLVFIEELFLVVTEMVGAYSLNNERKAKKRYHS